MKKCSKCGETKPLSEFKKEPSVKSGCGKLCKVCNRERRKEYYYAHQEEEKEAQRVYWKQNRVKLLERKKEKYKENPSLRREESLKRFKISLSDYDGMLFQQNGVCAICKNPETRMNYGKVNPLCVDHCHTTGKVRGLLCMACNSALGLLKDNPEILIAMYSYLVPLPDLFKQAKEARQLEFAHETL